MRLNSTKRQRRNFWVPWVTTIVLTCFSRPFVPQGMCLVSARFGFPKRDRKHA
jgi:hypothetical protein